MSKHLAFAEFAGERAGNRSAVTVYSAIASLRLPVRLNGILLGRPTDLIVELGEGRVLGFEVRCGDAANRFLPLAAASIAPEALELNSPLTLLAQSELAYYRKGSGSFRALAGRQVLQGAREAGALADLLFSAEGVLSAAVVREGEGTRALPYDGSVELGSTRSSAA